VNVKRRLWLGLLILVLLTPLGLLLPQWLRGETAWGEWSPQEIKERLGYVPHGMSRQADSYQAPLPDYSAPGGAPESPAAQSAWYLIAGLTGMAVVVVLMLALGRWLTRHEHTTDVDD
jgi:cobalt/nickel transport protein